jgi:hypothetical protein
MKNRSIALLTTLVAVAFIGSGCGPDSGGGGSTETTYRIEILDASFPDTVQWDSFDGPDPYVCIKTVDRNEYCTSTRTDTWNPSWLERSPYAYTFEQVLEVRVEAYDEDPDGDDLALQGTMALLQPNSDEVTVESEGGVSVRFRVVREEF